MFKKKKKEKNLKVIINLGQSVELVPNRHDSHHHHPFHWLLLKLRGIKEILKTLV